MDAATQGVGVRAEFVGQPGHFFRMVLVGNLLQIPTFGFYRFWLITDIRRHLWSHTRIGGESFEYTGRGRELLIGFLIAMAILTPIYVAYFMLGIEAELLQAFASLPLLVIIYVLAYYGNYRARRYRVTRTIFRGVRLWMTGSGWSFAGRAILWDLLTLITLGLALPWRSAALERYKMRNTYFGDLPASFAGTGGGLFKRGWWLWLLSIGIFIGLIAIAVASAAKGATHMQAAATFGSMIPLAMIVIFTLFYPLFRAVEMRWWLNGLRFGELTVTSSLRKRSVAWCYIKAMLVGFLFALAVGILAAILFHKAMPGQDFNAAEFDPFQMPAGFIVPVIMIYLVALLGFGVIMLHYVTRGVWRASVDSITVFNLVALDSVAAGGRAAGAVGEGLTDALDFGGVGV